MTDERPADGWRPGWRHRDWLNPPPQVARDQDDLLVTAAEGSDLWRTTSYGFIHDTGHALLTDFPDGTAAEVRFIADFSAQFDQAGLLVRADAEQWIKAGVELTDGVLQLGSSRDAGCLGLVGRPRAGVVGPGRRRAGQPHGRRPHRPGPERRRTLAARPGRTPAARAAPRGTACAARPRAPAWSCGSPTCGSSRRTSLSTPDRAEPSSTSARTASTLALPKLQRTCARHSTPASPTVRA